ncbi:protein draper-like isoform X2 [Haliotis rubra]|uniref:protein draper-like isoform X2 n=1 Tax=Haliotis rubra TaxID=36100 RepID=UPI001EE61CC6|nr:protein draper-like isoform X2 [Haliotis rubra]
MVSFTRLLVLLCSDLRRAFGCEWGKYGDTCERTCPQECAVNEFRQVRHCHRETGRCSEGCVAGWYGDLCDQPCSKTCLLSVCNQQNGQCTLGCSENTLGDFCEIGSASADTDHNVDVDSRPWFILFVLVVVVLCGCGVTQRLVG